MSTTSDISSNIYLCKDRASFDNVLNKAGLQICVLHFEADWAAECKQMNNVLVELAKEFPRTIFVRIPAEDMAEVTESYEVECVPTNIILRESKVLEKIEGFDASKVTKAVRHYSTTHVPPTLDVAATKMDLEERLKRLISSNPCMLFMKGNPSEPRCGFSREIIHLLSSHSIQFGHFDILSDNDVRQGLKKYSDWPTYPQLYSNGELIGGLDIVKELAESGEIADILPKKEDLNTRLEKLTKSAPVMIFMKGEPKKPQCKFSKALMGILDQHPAITFGHFNIFDDEEVRQGLKTFSNWPTFPQIYVNGELVGGLDIIKELNESGELLSTLTATT